jgi:ATP-dependent Zn protease
MVIDKTSRRSIAIHEAGHAVAAVILNLPRGGVTIEPEGEDLGYAIVGDPISQWERGDGPRRPLVEDHCVSLYSGWAAEKVLLGSTTVGSSADFEKARSCITNIGVRGASFVGDDIWERYENKLQLRAIQLVKMHRTKIEKVAERLMDQVSLTADEVEQVCTDMDFT